MQQFLVTVLNGLFFSILSCAGCAIQFAKAAKHFNRKNYTEFGIHMMFAIVWISLYFRVLFLVG